MCWKFDLSGTKEGVLQALRVVDQGEEHDTDLREAARDLLIRHVQNLPSDFVKVFAVGTSMGMSIEVEMLNVSAEAETLPPRATEPMPLPNFDVADGPLVTAEHLTVPWA